MRMWWPRSEPHTQAGLESGAALPERASLTGTGRPGTPCDRDALQNVKCSISLRKEAPLLLVGVALRITVSQLGAKYPFLGLNRLP